MNNTGVEFIPGILLDDAILKIWEHEAMGSQTGLCPMPPPLDASGQNVERLNRLLAPSAISSTNLPRFIQAVYCERPDLQKAFPEVQFGEINNFRNWLRDWGRYESAAIRLLGFDIPPTEINRVSAIPSSGADVVGFFNAEHGIGQAARLLVSALNSVNIETSNVTYRNSQSRQNVDFPCQQIGKFDVVITAINAELNEPLRVSFGQSLFNDRYVIGQWFWELETPPDWYGPNYKYVNELWAPTRFIEQMLRTHAPRDVVVTYMPLPLRVPEFVEFASKSEVGLPERFMFLFTFDFMSVAKRKNPVGLIQSFMSAFAEDEGPILVIKSINGSSRPKESIELKSLVDKRSDIFWIDEYFDSHQSTLLMNSCDCYVSLHRSEGLGLTIAEAMLLGKPVIATAYSGNLDFMTEQTSYLVPWKWSRVGDGADAYPRSARWAEPDLKTAARLMRYVWENPDKAKMTGAAGQRDLRARFTLEATGARMKSRLEEIWASRRDS